MTLDSNPPAAAAAIDTPANRDGVAGDSGYGWLMFSAFVSAAMAITFAVCILALSGSWWMLGVAVAAHIGITATMMTVVFGAFRADAYPDLEQTERASNALVAQQRLLHS